MSSLIGIVDYGVGNIFSIKRSLDYIGVKSNLISNSEGLAEADKIILPGVGAFGDAKDKLKASGLEEALLEQVRTGKPVLGICLGMQLLFDSSSEYGSHKGLGLIPGQVEDMRSLVTDKSLNIPQMGWNSLEFSEGREKNPLFKYVEEGSYVYFVHSYSALCSDEYIIARTDYSYPVTAAVAKDAVFGVQFHPEKSGQVGISMLKAFDEL